MKNLLLGAAALAVVAGVKADCEDTSFSGAFLGAGMVVSFDKDDLNVKFDDGRDGTINVVLSKKKNKTAFGGEIVLGYGYQFANNLYVAVTHASAFESKGKTIYSSMRGEDDGRAVFENSRKVYSPSFGAALGYVVDDTWNLGVRGGVSINKTKMEIVGSGEGVLPAAGKLNKTITATSPYVGAYAEYKYGAAVVYTNVDYVFGKKKKTYVDHDKGTAYINHKRSAWKVAVGVKGNINKLIAKI